MGDATGSGTTTRQWTVHSYVTPQGRGAYAPQLRRVQALTIMAANHLCMGHT
jgi:hypothetical protein